MSQRELVSRARGCRSTLATTPTPFEPTRGHVFVSKSLLEQLPGIVADGKRRASQILENLEGQHRVTLQTREFVIPSKDTTEADLFRELGTNGVDEMAPNRLIYGDNQLAMAALLAGDRTFPSMRGKIDLIYIDPPFDSKADYRSKITLPGVTLDQKPTVLEQFAYSYTWSDGTASYLAMMTSRLILMRELLADSGSIFVHIDYHVGHYARFSWMKYSAGNPFATRSSGRGEQERLVQITLLVCRRIRSTGIRKPSPSSTLLSIAAMYRKNSLTKNLTRLTKMGRDTGVVI